MDKSGKFLLPSPKFKKLETPSSTKRHFLSPQGIALLSKEQQPPPMYGPRGSTVPPKFLSPLKVPTTNNQFDRKQKYFCEPCEAEFHTSTDYKVHKSEHVKCEIDNCKFRGHPAFMDTHIGQQHATGLYEQLKKLSTPEEIAQWRADRKKNYPTVASVEQKWKAREQRLIRGEKLEMERKNRFGKRADRRQMKGDNSSENSGKTEPNTRKPNKNKNRKQRQRERRFENKKKDDVNPAPAPAEKSSVEIEVPEIANSRGLKMFKGTGAMADYRKVKKCEKNVLSSMLGMYGSDSDNDSENDCDQKEVQGTQSEELIKEAPDQAETRDDVAEDLPTQSKSAENPSTDPQHTIPEEASSSKSPSQIVAESKSSDDEAPEEAPIERTTHIPDIPEAQPSRKRTNPDESTSQDAPNPSATEKDDKVLSKSTDVSDKPPESEPPHKKTKPNPLKRKTCLDYRKLRLGRQNTMLEKLLEADIRHERNVLLQCVRFVVENNFFDKPNSTP